VPITRGRERSRPSADVIEEVRHLIARGYREVTLLGQTVNSYGKGSAVEFADLLAQLDAIDGLARIRFTSPHPCDMTPRAIAAMAALPSVCEHLHLPLQSGSDRMLDRMARGYTIDHYLQVADAYRRAVPGGALSTDIIVGFPGETAADFEQTYEAAEAIGFDNLFVFKYSRRPNTPAAVYDDQIAEPVKDERLQRLLELNRRQSTVLNRALIGTTQELLIEGRSARDPARLTGRTRTNRVVHLAGDDALIGRLVDVRIDRASNASLDGELLSRA
jgi:tRNA-2-methylthio-N6-dimethylallyladenosine synthase